MSADTSLFEEAIENNEDLSKKSSINGEVVFEVTKDFDDRNLFEEFESELLDISFPDIPKELENPCAPETEYLKFREQMVKMNEKIYKKIIKPGSGEAIDFERLKVTYDYSMFTEGSVDPFDSSFINKQVGVINVKSGIEPLPGCYLALATMKKREEAIFWISNDLMFGKLGFPPRIRPNADILLRAKILSVEKVRKGKTMTGNADDQPEEKTPFQQIHKEVYKKYCLAYEKFSNRDYNEAINIYRKWIDKLEKARLSNDDEEMEQKRLLKMMYLNVCICYNKIGKPEKTCVMMREYEKLAPIRDNAKALLAKGKAKMMLKDFEFARKYLSMARNIMPENSQIKAAIQELNRLEETRTKYKADYSERLQLFNEERIAAEERKREETEKKQKELEALQLQLKKLEVDLRNTIGKFKDDDSIKFLSIQTDQWSHQEFNLARNICEQNGVQLKGIESVKSEYIIYYLMK